VFKSLAGAIANCAAVMTVLMLVSCGAPRTRPGAAQSRAPAAAGQLQTGAQVYRIDPAQSELRVLVYRAGPLARLGHNHVLVNRALRGSVSLGGSPIASSFTLHVPVAEFVIDDAQSRREEGDDFPGEVPEDAKAGTRHNMLSSALLDAADYAEIVVDGVGERTETSTSTSTSTVTGAGVAGTVGVADLLARLTIRVAGHESRVQAPFTLENSSHRLSATGSLDLRQSAIGLTPYSLMLGALQVQDMVRLKFRIVAVDT
jgi:hypothetical protein